VRLNVSPKPIANVANTVLTNCQGQTVNLNGFASSGTPPYAYEWYPDTALNFPNIPNPEVAPSVTQFYQFVVKDSMGCQSDTTNVLVNVEQAPIVDVGPDQIICQGGAGVTLTANVLNPGFTGYSYQWIPALGLTNPNSQSTYANPPVTTTYTCVATSLGAGCSSDVTTLDTLAYVTVFVRPRPYASAGPDRTVCQFDSVQIGGTPSGGTSPLYTYLWQPSTGLSDSTAQLPMASPPATTTYYLTVFSDGCLSVADTMTITVDPRPNLVILTPDTAICPYDSLQLQVSLGGVPGTPEIFWTPAAGLNDSTLLEPTAQPQTTTQYIINLVTPQCVAPTRDTVTITVIELPIVNANTTGQQLFICYEDSLVMPASVTHSGPFTTLWSPTQWVTDSTIIGTTAFPLVQTMFYLTAYSNGCSATDSVEVFVADSILAIATVDSPFICRGSQVYLRSLTPAPAFYFWSPSASLLDTVGPVVLAGPTETTTYTLRVERDGCTDTASVTVTVLPQPFANFAIPQATGCEGETVQFQNLSTDATAFVWQFGDGGVSNDPNPVYTYDSAGTYTVTLIATTVGTCTDTLQMSQAITVRPRAQASFRTQPELPATLYLPHAQVQFTSSSQGTPNALHIWEFGDGQTSTDRNPTHTYQQPGQYTIRLTVMDDAGCTSTVEQSVLSVLAPELALFNVFTPDGDGINDTWKPQYVGSERMEVYLYDRWGNLVHSHTGTEGEWNGTTNGSNAPAGHYFYVVKVGDKVYKGGITLLRNN
jgi:gliding motility-associated-like protein